MVMQDHLSTPHFAAISNDGIVFDLMSQHRKGTHVCNQPQFDLLSPLYSNPPLWPGAGFVRGHNGCEPQEIPRADLEGLVGGDPVLADGNIIRRFVWFSSCMYVMGHLWFPRFSWQMHAISWMLGELWDKRELSPQCGEACIFVLNEVWSHLIRLVLLRAHYAVVVSNS